MVHSREIHELQPLPFIYKTFKCSLLEDDSLGFLTKVSKKKEELEYRKRRSNH